MTVTLIFAETFIIGPAVRWYFHLGTEAFARHPVVVVVVVIEKSLNFLCAVVKIEENDFFLRSGVHYLGRYVGTTCEQLEYQTTFHKVFSFKPSTTFVIANRYITLLVSIYSKDRLIF